MTAHNDPKKMGRIQVRFFWQGDGSTHWARATAPHAGPDRGFMFMPEVGDEVAVAFEDGDPERPVILGSLWNGVQQAPRYDFRGGDIEPNNVKRLVTKSGNRLHLSDKPGQETVFLATPNHTSLNMTEHSDETGRQLVHLHSDGDIVLSAGGRVHIQSQFFSREIGSPGKANAAPAAIQASAAVASTNLGHGRVYTNNLNERATARTRPTARQLVSAIHNQWPELNETGARTLAAQSMHETGNGIHCYNWNLGNVKAGPDQEHMYLQHTWEQFSLTDAQAQISKSGGLAHIATPEEMKQHGWIASPRKVVTVFDPPSPQARFRAYDSLDDGVQKWVTHQKLIAQQNPVFLTELNSGNTNGVAKTLQSVHYYTGDEQQYARGLSREQTAINNELGDQ